MYEIPIIDNIATGKNIEKLRKKNGYSVKQLQEILLLGSPQAIYKWQWGQTIPDIQNLVTLAKLFNCQIEDILVFEDTNKG